MPYIRLGHAHKHGPVLVRVAIPTCYRFHL